MSVPIQTQNLLDPVGKWSLGNKMTINTSEHVRVSMQRATDMLTLTASSYYVQALLVVLRMTCRLENNYYWAVPIEVRWNDSQRHA